MFVSNQCLATVAVNSTPIIVKVRLVASTLLTSSLAESEGNSTQIQRSKMAYSWLCKFFAIRRTLNWVSRISSDFITARSTMRFLRGLRLFLQNQIYVPLSQWRTPGTSFLQVEPVVYEGRTVGFTAHASNIDLEGGIVIVYHSGATSPRSRVQAVVTFFFFAVTTLFIPTQNGRLGCLTLRPRYH